MRGCLKLVRQPYGWLLMVALASLLVILVGYGEVRQSAIFPKWSTIRKGIKHLVRTVGVHG